MTRRPRVPGLSDEWAAQQLDLLEQIAENPATAYGDQPGAPVCSSCTLVMSQRGQVGHAWTCDPDRPGCPLHAVPEQTREHAAPRCWCAHREDDHLHLVTSNRCTRCDCQGYEP